MAFSFLFYLKFSSNLVCLSLLEKSIFLVASICHIRLGVTCTPKILPSGYVPGYQPEYLVLTRIRLFSLGVEVAGTDNHFRVALATKENCVQLTLHHINKLGFERLYI
jgi:hypothetical protein